MAVSGSSLEQWQLGVVTSCLGSLLGTLGVQLRILAFLQADPRRCTSEVDPSFLRSAKFLEIVGWVLWIAGQALGQVAISLAPATIVACVGFSGALASNAALAPVVLGERLSWSHGLGLLMLSAGGSAVTATSTHVEQDFALAELLEFAQRAPFVVVAVTSLATVGALTAQAVRERHLHVWSFAFVWALVGAVDLLITKCTLGLLRAFFVGAEGDASVPPSLVLVVATSAMVMLHILQLGCQVASTRYGEALQNMPVFLASGAMAQVSICGVFFDEFAGFGLGRSAGFLAGFGLLLGGLGVTCRATAASAIAAKPHEDLPGQDEKVQPPLQEPLLIEVETLDDILSKAGPVPFGMTPVTIASTALTPMWLSPMVFSPSGAGILTPAFSPVSTRTPGGTAPSPGASRQWGCWASTGGGTKSGSGPRFAGFAGA